MVELDTIKVSVILPFYNAPFLKDAIESLINQQYDSYEIILVDNGSTDHSKKIAHSFKDHPKIILLNEPRKGVVHASLAGFKQSKGSFIARMDADDICHVDRLKDQVAFLQNRRDIDLVSSLVEYLGPKENRGFQEYVKWLNSVSSPSHIALNQFVEFPIANPSIMFRRSLIETYGFYRSGSFPEDYEWFLRLQEQGIQMAKVEKHLLQWRDSENRLTRTDDKYSQQAFFKIKSQYLARWLSAHNPMHPNIVVWGGGRVSRRRSEHLVDKGINITHYIDVKESANTRLYTNLPSKEEAFVVSYVRNRGAREEIREYLHEHGYQEGIHFIMAS